MSTVDTALIVGVGLIGGSLAGALKQSDFARRVVGMDSDQQAAATALERGLIDEVVQAPPGQVDMAAVCTSSEQIAAQVAALARRARMVMDVGSVKVPILQALANEHGGVPDNFVACHPIAGSELSGPAAARADLFEQAVTVISAEPDSDEQQECVRLAAAAWQAAGAEVLYLDAAAHDQMLAVTSHLPHLLAFAYMQQVDAALLPYTGGGFRDFTRIAAANPELWWRILSMNREQVLAAADAFSDHMQQLTRALAADDAEAGIEALRSAALLRKQL